MKVYLAWNDGDYYGPDPVPSFVHATLEGAQAACVTNASVKDGVWNRSRYGGKPEEGFWYYSKGSYYVEEVEVEE